MGSLDPEPYRTKLQEIYEALKTSMPAELLEAQEAALKDARDEDAVRQIEEATLAAAIAEGRSNWRFRRSLARSGYVPLQGSSTEVCTICS